MKEFGEEGNGHAAGYYANEILDCRTTTIHATRPPCSPDFVGRYWSAPPAWVEQINQRCRRVNPLQTANPSIRSVMVVCVAESGTQAVDLILEKQMIRLFQFLTFGFDPLLSTNSKETELARNRMLSSEKTSRINAVEVKIKHLAEARERTVLKAPTDGTVTALAMKHGGSVLGPDSPAAVILPDNVPLRARVKIQNASMRRLKHGMPVRIRFDAFPHQDYGFMLGRLLRIEPDASKGPDPRRIRHHGGPFVSR